MADVPLGPWIAPGTSAAAEDDDPFAEERAAPILTGTAFDEFLPIYAALARWTDTHGPFSQDQVDRMDLSVVAALMGVSGSSFDGIAAEWRNDYEAEMERFRAEQETARTGA